MKIVIPVFILILLGVIFINRISSRVYNTNMRIQSSAFENNMYMASRYSCDGEKVNPPLHFSDIPNMVKSLALIVDDPDAPMGTFVHWVVYNIPPAVTEVKENSSITGAADGTNSTGKIGFVPACPPSGTHRYFFKLYALDTMLQLSPNANKQQVEQAMQNHILAQAELIGLYKRK